MRIVLDNDTHSFSRYLIKVFGSVLSGILIILIFPNTQLSFLAWVALVPVILVCWNSSAWQRCLLGFITGVVALFGIHYWLLVISDFGWVQAVILELIYASFYLFWTFGLFYLNKSRFSVYLLAFYWVVIEYIRSHLGFMANPFATLAHSQSDNLAIIQLASITGEYGISFLIILTNLALARWIINSTLDRQIISVIILVVGAHLWGLQLLHQEPDNSKAVKAAVIQPCLSIEEVSKKGGNTNRFLRMQKHSLSVKNQQPDLYVWPESGLKNIHSNQPLREMVKSFAHYLNRPILTGVSTFNYREKKSKNDSPQNYNGAFYITADQTVAPPYFKNILLPFREYVPLQHTFNWPDWLILDDFGIQPGTTLSRYQLKDNIHFSVIICWENLFSEFVRRIVRQDIGMLVHIVNDNWFGKTSASRQHSLASILRAVENRVPVIVASNTGPSIIIDAYGRIVASLPDLFRQGAVVGEVHTLNQQTVYNRFGDWFVGLAAVVLIIHFVYSKRR